MKIEDSKISLSTFKEMLQSIEEKLQGIEYDEVIIELEYGRENFLFSPVQPRLVEDLEGKKKRIVISITRDI